MSGLAIDSMSRWQAAKLERVVLTGDRRKGETSNDTLKARVDFAARGRHEGQEWSAREDANEVFRERPEEAKKRKRGSNTRTKVILPVGANGSLIGAIP
jgi:hypothetical protein